MGILSDAPAAATLPITDMDRAKAFYGGTLGLAEVQSPDSSSSVTYTAGDGTQFMLYQRGPTTADHTVLSFRTPDFNSAASALRAAGVVFEEYDIPDMGLKTVDGVAEMGELKGAWFKDPDGNILGIFSES